MSDTAGHTPTPSQIMDQWRAAFEEIISREDKAWKPFLFRSEHEKELDDARHEAWTEAADIARDALRLAEGEGGANG